MKKLKKLLANFTAKGIYLLLGIALSLSVYSVQAAITGGTISVDGSNNLTFFDSGSGLTKTLFELSAWPTSGSDVYFTDGNVGIGTSNPTSELHIYDATGDAVQKIESDGGEATLILDSGGSSNDSQIIIQEAGTEVVRLWWDASASKFHIYNNDGGAGTDQLVLDSTGNIGVGTASPLFKLDVAGTVDVTNLRVDNGYIYAEGNGNVWLGDNIAADNFYFNIDQGVWTSDGNFGIGTITPAQKLDVVGSAQISNDLYLTDGKSIIVDKNNGDSGIFLGNYGDGKAFCYANDNSGDCAGTKYSAGIFVEGTVKASEFCIGDTDCKLSWGEIAGNLWTDAGVYVYANNASNVVVTDLGNVGIGTTVPGTILSIENNLTPIVKIKNSDATSNKALIQWDYGTGSWYAGVDEFSDGGTNWFLWGNGLSRMTVSSAGYVGIGTTNPTRTLQVNSSQKEYIRFTTSQASQNNYITVETTGASSSVGMQIGKTGSGNMSGIRGGGELRFITGATDGTVMDQTPKMIITSTGNVGIGTTTPTFPFHVSNNYSSWQARFQNTNTNGATVYLAHGNGYGAYIDAGADATASTYALDVNKGGTSYLRVRGDGRVGIGKASPSGTLDVQGSICFSGDCKSSWSAAAGNLWTDAGTYVYANNNSNVRIYDTGTVSATSFSGNGASLTSLNASNLSSGTVPNARLDGDLQDLADGSLTGSKVGSGIAAGNITSGTLSNARFSALSDLGGGSGTTTWLRKDGSWTNPDTTLSESTVESYIANDISSGSVPYDNGTKLVGTQIGYNSSTGDVWIGTPSSTGSPRLSVRGSVTATRYEELDSAGGFFLDLNNPVQSANLYGKVTAPRYEDTNASYYIDPASSQSANFAGYIDATSFRDEDNTSYYLNPSSTSYLNDVRADIFYDRNNTSYYVNPASTSNFNVIQTNQRTTDCIGGWTCTAYFWDISLGSVLYSGLTQRSDIRLKKNIISIDQSSILNRLSKIRPVSYNWKDLNISKETKYGFIAQEIEEIFPELVTTDESEQKMKSLDYTGLIAPLVAAVQELKQENDDLKIENNILRAKTDDFETRIKALELK